MAAAPYWNPRKVQFQKQFGVWVVRDKRELQTKNGMKSLSEFFFKFLFMSC